MNKKVLIVIVLLVLIVAAALNILWKFSTGDFSDMPFFRQVNVVASIILIVSGGVGICGIIYMSIKSNTRK